MSYLLFYAYYVLCVGLFAMFWFVYSPHRWQYWSILRHVVNHLCHLVPGGGGRSGRRRYAPFYNLIQTALSSPHKVTINQFYHEVGSSSASPSSPW
ncbi:SbmA/BacA-like family transporter [Enterobacter hormaechei]